MHWIALPLPCWEDEPPADLGALGWWALRFTPRVALVDGEALLLEVSTTERLWGGRDALLAQVCEAWALAGPATGAGTRTGPGGPVAHPHGPALVWGSGPTAMLAQAVLRMALAGRALPSRMPQGLPLHTLTALRPHVASLERMGCRTWGALQALPRAGVARRFGAAVLQALDQALGHAPQAHTWLELPESFGLSVELPALAESADALLWSAGRCLTALQGWLQARQQGVQGVELTWRHDLRRIDGVAVPPTGMVQVRTAQATQDMAHLRRLLSENLARTTLAAPANHIALRLLESAALPHRSASLLPPDDRRSDGGAGGPPAEALHQLVERLSARLGTDRVLAPVLQADHRPERMQQWRPAAEVLRVATPADSTAARRVSTAAARAAATDAALDATPDAALQPTWLLNPPRRLAVQGNRPCHHGRLRLLDGPHRFEAGWWTAAQDGADPAHPDAGLALRDYFVAYNEVAGLVWVFREHLARLSQDTQASVRPHRWFLHGIFG
ncbi:DNA polymerase Y family protein [Acidovorax sp. sic0104]|uniref:Y-family DNA polymerase n=1 Tax=Acidovorax sp. sic0104 TaxID=2854784 RepID=UPI001C482419|nr:DNA polymerase Y family protein [Acidovorax sp. sic0104]MBV7543908.1 DNA polymerase Y family protein [Acidovorax sp. sic0104]